MMLKNTNYHPKPVGDRDERWEMYLREYNTTDGSNFKQRIKNEKREAQSQTLWPSLFDMGCLAVYTLYLIAWEHCWEVAADTRN